MLQIAVSGGEVKVLDVPAPVVRPGGVLVRTEYSVISVGTESASTGGGGRENLLMKAIRNPTLVRKVTDRVSSHGIQSTAGLVRSRLSSDQATGYSCAGAGYANHAEVNFVPANLVAKVPEGLALDEAAFATLAAIALHGVRRCAPTLGERVVVLGLGLLGQLTAQLLRTNGHVVLGAAARLAPAC